jgi:hypothetical protein
MFNQIWHVISSPCCPLHGRHHKPGVLAQALLGGSNDNKEAVRLLLPKPTKQLLYRISLLGSITHWFDNTLSDKSEYTPKYQLLVQDQHNTIGWKHVFQGRISSEWASLQQAQLDRLTPIKGQDGANWVKTILLYTSLVEGAP